MVLDVVGCCNQGTIFAADATAFSFLDNNKKGEKLIHSFLCTMSKEDWLQHLTYKAFHLRIEHYSVFYTEKNVRKIKSLSTLEAYRFFSSQHWLNVGSFLENFVLLLV